MTAEEKKHADLVTHMVRSSVIMATLLWLAASALAFAVTHSSLATLLVSVTSLGALAFWQTPILEAGDARRLFADVVGLFQTYRPSQERVDESLTLLAQALAAACETQIRFYQNAPHYVASGVGTAMDALASADEYKKLDSQNADIRRVIAAGKEQFWTLHRRVKDAGFKVRESWKDYLPAN